MSHNSSQFHFFTPFHHTFSTLKPHKNMVFKFKFNTTIIITTTTLITLLSLIIHPIQAYEPVDQFTINCGSTSNSDDDDQGRTWTGNTDTKLLSFNNPTITTTTTVSSSTNNRIPYSTARLSRSQFNYSFPVSPGPKFLRLFFYPTTYSPGNFNRNDASFTVVSNGFTLLRDFNASLNADAQGGDDTVFREYVVNVDGGQRLDLSFTPSSTKESYAFVNGIEVVSMPSDLYYTPSGDPGFTLVGIVNNQYKIETSAALQTDYRVKVGGKLVHSEPISPKSNTGMLRNWEGDDDYITTPSALPADLTGSMNITVKPDYVAPKDLYRTARDMGPNKTYNKLSNLTWEFPVDSGFYYVVRLHFCELDPNINDVSQRVFFVYLQGQVAESHADVMRWSGKQRGVAVHKNYAVLIPKSTSSHKIVNLRLQLHPATEDATLYSDPFLNGLEIFRISDVGSKNLAGPNPDPVQAPDNKNTEKKKKSRTTLIRVVALAGVLSGVVLISLLVIFFIFKRKATTTTTTTNTQNSSLPSHLCRLFSLAEIRAATNNFDEHFIVCVGGFGHVYKGYTEGATPVAIKRLKPGSQQGANEFVNEIDMLSKLRHLHLVSLIGYCHESNEMILVYDFMARGTLRDHLYNTDNPPLSWKQRLQICIGATRGLHYLHTGAKYTIIHRDVKTTNILLDEKWVANVSDFGLSRIGPTGVSKSHVRTGVKGTIGYLDPEYYKRLRLTEKSDVYSFGVVLFEILCARPPLIDTTEKTQVSLTDWARQCHQNGTLWQIVDPAMKGSIAPECLRKFGEIGVSCLLDDGTQRPSMTDVVWMLEFALQLQESAEQRDCGDVEGIGRRREESDHVCCNSQHAPLVGGNVGLATHPIPY